MHEMMFSGPRNWVEAGQRMGVRWCQAPVMAQFANVTTSQAFLRFLFMTRYNLNTLIAFTCSLPSILQSMRFVLLREWENLLGFCATTMSRS